MYCKDCLTTLEEIEELQKRLNELENQGCYGSGIESIEKQIKQGYDYMDNCSLCRSRGEVARDLFGLDVSELDEIDTKVVDAIIKIEAVESYLAYDNAEIAINLLRALYSKEFAEVANKQFLDDLAKGQVLDQDNPF